MLSGLFGDQWIVTGVLVRNVLKVDRICPKVTTVGANGLELY